MDPLPAKPRRVGSRAARRIIAFGGHELGGNPHDRAVRDLLLDAAARRAGEAATREPGPPRICLLPTASGDPVEQCARFHGAFADRGCEVSDLSLFRLTRRPVALRDLLLSQDLIYVGGGSLVNLLAIWEAHDVGAMLRLAWQQGIVLGGQSAGAMCWFEAGVTKSWGPSTATAGLGYLPGALCVHYHGEPDRRAAFLAAVGRGMPGGYGLDDHAALIWEGERLAEALSLREGAGAYSVAVRDGEVVETALAARPVRLVETLPEADEIAELRQVLRIRPRLVRRA